MAERAIDGYWARISYEYDDLHHLFSDEATIALD